MKSFDWKLTLIIMVIDAIFLVIGFGISGWIADNQMDANAVISDETHFYDNSNIEETVEHPKSSGGAMVAFWIVWVLLIGVAEHYVFLYIFNRWLDRMADI